MKVATYNVDDDVLAMVGEVEIRKTLEDHDISLVSKSSDHFIPLGEIREHRREGDVVYIQREKADSGFVFDDEEAAHEFAYYLAAELRDFHAQVAQEDDQGYEEQ